MNTEDLIFTANCYLAGGLSITLSLLLMYAIVFHTPPEMKTYRIFLLNVNISDLIVSTLMTMLQWIPASSKKEIERPSNDSGISYIIKGPVIYFLHPHYNHMFTCVFMGAFLYNILSLPASFGFRYICLSHAYIVETLLQKKVLIPFFGFLICVSFSVFMTMYLGDMPKTGPVWFWHVTMFGINNNEVQDFSEYWHHKNDSNETRIGNLIHLKFMVYYSVLIIGTFVFIGYIILIFSGIQIFRMLKQSKKHLTSKTLKMHRSLALTLAFQSCLPLIFVLIPLFTIVISIWAELYSETVNSVAMLFFSYEVVLSPIFTFIFVRPYRIALLRKTLRIKPINKLIGSYISANTTTANTVAPTTNMLDRRGSTIANIKMRQQALEIISANRIDNRQKSI